MSQGLDNLEHIVVLMMENRSFDHMLGATEENKFPGINGLNGNEWNLDEHWRQGAGAAKSALFRDNSATIQTIISPA